MPDNPRGELEIAAGPGETVDSDGFTSRQIAGLRDAGVRSFALPARLPARVRLKSVRINFGEDSLICVVLTYDGRGADTLFTYTFGAGPCTQARYPLSFKTPDPSRFAPPESGGRSAPTTLAAVKIRAPAFGDFVLTPVDGCYRATPMDKDMNIYEIAGLCPTRLRRDEILILVSSSRMKRL